MYTPWGESDSQEKVHSGVYVVSTPGHGGIMVQPYVFALGLLSEQCRAIGEQWYGSLAYEEDCNWAAVVYERPEWFTTVYQKDVAQLRDQAKAALMKWHPEYFANGDPIEQQIKPPAKMPEREWIGQLIEIRVGGFTQRGEIVSVSFHEGSEDPNDYYLSVTNPMDGRGSTIQWSTVHSYTLHGKPTSQTYDWIKNWLFTGTRKRKTSRIFEAWVKREGVLVDEATMHRQMLARGEIQHDWNAE
jgi:hypothetical protein